jgi:hypothetical protein
MKLLQVISRDGARLYGAMIRIGALTDATRMVAAA